VSGHEWPLQCARGRGGGHRSWPQCVGRCNTRRTQLHRHGNSPLAHSLTARPLRPLRPLRPPGGHDLMSWFAWLGTPDRPGGWGKPSNGVTVWPSPPCPACWCHMSLDMYIQLNTSWCLLCTSEMLSSPNEAKDRQYSDAFPGGLW